MEWCVISTNFGLAREKHIDEHQKCHSTHNKGALWRMERRLSRFNMNNHDVAVAKMHANQSCHLWVSHVACEFNLSFWIWWIVGCRNFSANCHRRRRLRIDNTHITLNKEGSHVACEFMRTLTHRGVLVKDEKQIHVVSRMNESRHIWIN